MADKIKSLLSRWRSNPQIVENVVAWRVLAPKSADFSSFPNELSPKLVSALQTQGVHSLYTHQARAYNQATQGENIAVVSGTASGKTLCYNLPVVDGLLKQPQFKALYLFPTKALAQDQLSALQSIVSQIDSPHIRRVSIYDGDTPQHLRPVLRKESSIIFTNPDMLHTGILPHHTAWKNFFNGIRFIIIDEMHAYRGVFGSHVANVLRRLQRICRFYGSQPQFILTSATIANPKILAERLVEQPVNVIEQDGSPHGERNFLIYNPPLVDKKLGIRRSSMLEGTALAGELINDGIQTIIFGRTRRGIELILTYLRQKEKHGNPSQVRGYRSGYLSHERRSIEDGLRRGEVKGVVATNALELGIDIGDMDASVIISYPGSIASTTQQAGRAGRKTSASLSILVTSANAIDQYLARHPEYFFERSPEHALIEPNNLLILLQHIRCAAFELPFSKGEGFGTIPKLELENFLNLLAESGELHQQADRFYWMADRYPASSVSLRNASPNNITLIHHNTYAQETIGQVDLDSAYWMVHPNAIYLHEGATFLVENLDLETGVAHLRDAIVDYYTQATINSQVEGQSLQKQAVVTGAIKSLGEVLVTNQVTGYRKIRWFTHEFLGGEEINLPPTFLNTVGYWFSLTSHTIDKLKSQMVWHEGGNAYGPDWENIRQQVLNRDGHQCQVCGASGNKQPLHVHHIQPFKTFTNLSAANRLQNLISLCPSCHRQAEVRVRVRSGIAGISYLLHNLAPLLLMCDTEDIGVHYDPNSTLGDGQPTLIIYDNIPGGLGLSENLYQRHDQLLRQGYETITQCECEDGCPSCVGPIGDEGSGGKAEAQAIFEALINYG